MHGGAVTVADERETSRPAVSRPGRLASLDLLRGLVVLLMLFVNQADSVEGASAFLRHAGEDADTVTLADLVLPAFLFMVGMSIPFALARRLEGGRGEALRHVLARAAALLVMGVLMVNADEQSPTAWLAPEAWGSLAVLGALLAWLAPPEERARRPLWRAARLLGIALLVALVFLYRSREVGGLVQLRPQWWGILGIVGWAYLTAAIAYIVVRDRPLVLLAVVAVQNGLYYAFVLLPASAAILPPWLGLGGLLGSQGAVSVAGLVLGVIAARHARDGGSRWSLAGRALGLALVLLAAGLLLHLGHHLHPAFAYSKNDATPPWGLVSSAVTAVAWLVFFAAADAGGVRRWPPLLPIAGRNALLTYLLEPLVLAVLAASAAVFGRNPWGYLVERGTAAGLLSAALFACVLGHLAGLLARAGLRLRL